MVIYKVINLINEKYYIGKDAKNNPNYLGSGILIKKAINKYGAKNFRKEILDTFSNLNDLNKAECRYVNKDVVNDPKSYNLALGGQGGDFSKFFKKRKKTTWEERYGKEKSDQMKKQLSLSRSGKNHGMYNKHHTLEARKKMSKKGKGKGKITSEKTKTILREIFININYEERYGNEKAKQIKSKQSISQKNRNRGYIIQQINLDGKCLNEFKTISEAINILNISKKKAYSNTFKDFKFVKKLI